MTPPARRRRERAAKPALSRESIVSETIKIVRVEGLEKATMRRVAQALDTGQASLYVHIANTAELHAAVLDELTAALPADVEGDWITRMEALLHSYSRVLFTYPGLARSALLLRPMGPHTLRLLDRILGLMLEGGVPSDRAAWGADLLLQHITATAAEHSRPVPNDIIAPTDSEGAMNALTAALNAANPSDTPHVAAHAEALLSGTPRERESWMVRTILAGIIASPAPASLLPNDPITRQVDNARRQ